jgi:hypothetical protein
MFMTLSLCAFGATAAIGQSPATPPNAAKATNQSKDTAAKQIKKAKEPNQVLASAYHQSLLTFSQALHGQAVGSAPMNVDCARSAVTEIRRSYDMMEKYNKKYMETLSAETRTKEAATTKQMETYRADLNVRLTELEKEIALDVPDAKTVATLTTALQTHLNAMSKLDKAEPTDKLTNNM